MGEKKSDDAMFVIMVSEAGESKFSVYKDADGRIYLYDDVMSAVRVANECNEKWSSKCVVRHVDIVPWNGGKI